MSNSKEMCNSKTYIHHLNGVFQKNDALSSYLVNFHPYCVSGVGVSAIPCDVFYKYFWYCDESMQDFVKSNSNTSCNLICIPDVPAVGEDELNRHAEFLSAYFAYIQGCKKIRSLQGYIRRHSSREDPFYIDSDVQDVDKIRRLVTDRLIEPTFKALFYLKNRLESEVRKVLFATKQNPYYSTEADNIFSETAFALLLGELIRDGGATEREVFYCVSRNQYETERYTQMFEVVKSLLEVLYIEKCVPRINFTFYVFCTPIPIGKSRHMEQQATYNDISLFDEEYYKCDMFTKNLTIRIERVQEYIEDAELTEEQLESAKKTKEQMLYLQQLIGNENSLERISGIAFHRLLKCVQDTWDELKRLNEKCEHIDIICDVWPILLSNVAKNNMEA